MEDLEPGNLLVTTYSGETYTQDEMQTVLEPLGGELELTPTEGSNSVKLEIEIRDLPTTYQVYSVSGTLSGVFVVTMSYIKYNEKEESHVVRSPIPVHILIPIRHL